MEPDLTKVRRWVKQGDAGEEPLHQLLLSAVDKVQKFRGVLTHIGEPQRKIPQCSELDELMGTGPIAARPLEHVAQRIL